MYGPKLSVEYGGLGINLVPYRLEQAQLLADMLSSLKVTMNTNMFLGLTEKDEEEWINATRKDQSSVVWAIVPDGEKNPIGVTGIHRIDMYSGTCTTGMIIFQPDWWEKGVATKALLAVTWFAADMLNRVTTHSTADAGNIASIKTQKRAGYIPIGKELRTRYRDGKYRDTMHLTWLHPEKIGLLYPEGVPKSKKLQDGLKKAQIALDKAREVVTLL